MEKNYKGLMAGSPRKLTLDDYGLKYEMRAGTYSLAWDKFDHRIERAGLGGAICTVILVTRDDKWFAVTAFKDMPEIVTTLQQKVPTSGPQNMTERVLFHPWFNPMGFTIGLLGMLLVLVTPPSSAYQEKLVALGWLLMAPGAIVSLYALPRNPLMKLVVAGQRQGLLRRFFIYLAVWIAIVFAVLFILNFVVPRLR